MRIFRARTYQALLNEHINRLEYVKASAYQRGLADGRAKVLHTEREEFIRELRALFLASSADAPLAAELLKVYDGSAPNLNAYFSPGNYTGFYNISGALGNPGGSSRWSSG